MLRMEECTCSDTLSRHWRIALTLPQKQREKRHRGGEKIFYHKCNQACQFLACLGLLEAEGEFYEDKCYKITALGSEVAKRKRTNIVKRYVEQVKREMKMPSR